MAAPLLASSKARSGMAYSVSTTENAPKVLVSTASQPTRRNESCSSAITSGRVTLRISLQPSSSGPPKSSRVRSASWRLVPAAPSNTRTRSRSACRKSLIDREATGAPPGISRRLPRSAYGRGAGRDPPAAVDEHRVVGAREQLRVAVAVAVRVDRCPRAVEPRVEPACLLRTAHVGPEDLAGEATV